MGVCVPLDPIDFERREWIPHSGWPITLTELQPHYDRACERLEIPRFDRSFDEPQLAGRPPVVVNGARRITSRPHFITRYTGRVREGPYESLKRSTARHPRVAVYLNANVTRIRRGRNPSRVEEVQVDCLNGRRHRARGRCFILATGGIENARLLLASDDVGSAGLGNETDWVGRCFQGHAIIRDRGSFLFRKSDSSMILVHGADSLSLYARGQGTFCVLGTTARAQRQARSSNFSVYVRGAADTTTAAATVHGLASSLHRSRPEIPAGSHLRVWFAIEHTPNRASRVSIVPGQRDALGMPRVKLDWHNGPLDFEGFERSIALLVRELGSHDAGRVQWYPKGGQTPRYLRPAARHHMGTTRMASDPGRGVVNEQCRVHGIDNLYVAGSSVFPTSGIANPTLTIVALAMRMGEHLHERLRG